MFPSTLTDGIVSSSEQFLPNVCTSGSRSLQVQLLFGVVNVHVLVLVELTICMSQASLLFDVLIQRISSKNHMYVRVGRITVSAGKADPRRRPPQTKYHKKTTKIISVESIRDKSRTLSLIAIFRRKNKIER